MGPPMEWAWRDQHSPVTGSAAPWMARAAGDARNTIVCARSAGATQRSGFAAGMSARFSGVSSVVGSTQLTLMFRSRSSAAIDSVRRITTAFDAPYAPMLALPFNAASAPTLTTFPPPCSSIRGTTARTMLSRLRTLASSSSSKVASVISCTASPIRNAPATLHSTSMRPKRSIAFCATASASPCRTRSAATSSWTAFESPKRSTSLSRFRSTRTIRAPRAANAPATTRPRLPAAPVTTTVCPVKSTVRWSASPSRRIALFRADRNLRRRQRTSQHLSASRRPDNLLSSRNGARTLARLPRLATAATPMETLAAPIRRKNALGIHSLNRFAFSVPDLTQAEAFYRAFGLDVLREGERLDLRTHGNPHCWGSVHANGAPKKLQYLSFSAYAEDLDALGRRIAASGSCEAHPLSGGEGLWIRDPDGTPVQVVAGAKVSSSGKVPPP